MPDTVSAPQLSIILPCMNEESGLNELLPLLKSRFPDAEIVVVDDGSTDRSAEVARISGARVISHPHNLGNGAAVKTGARNATGNLLLFMDADGQHNVDDIERLLTKLDEGYDMVVGAREADTHASLPRRLANAFYNRLASLMTGKPILDLTSGFRVARAGHFRQFLYLLPNGFSYPTTSTMAFFRSAFPVAYVPIRARQRSGSSKIRALRDGIRFLIIILKIGALYSPMRLFLPVSTLMFTAGGIHYVRTYLENGRFTNMSMLLFLAAIFTFLMGILSEQISSLHYRHSETQEPVDRTSTDQSG
ncbi:MAG: glycosyltransferase family 2 protein [Gammaproteobacteria bacterium]|nr:glycosyltransferase family 2 protein [Gammaproteobacteria bacterium]